MLLHHHNKSYGRNYATLKQAVPHNNHTDFGLQYENTIFSIVVLPITNYQSPYRNNTKVYIATMNGAGSLHFAVGACAPQADEYSSTVITPRLLYQITW